VSLCYLGKEVVDAVDGQVEGRETAGEEAPPPPVVILPPEDVNTPTTTLVPTIGTPMRFQTRGPAHGCNGTICSLILLLKFLIEFDISRLRHSHMVSCIIRKII
jgi:hypothetical protein